MSAIRTAYSLPLRNECLANAAMLLAEGGRYIDGDHWSGAAAMSIAWILLADRIPEPAGDEVA